ncbi:MAG TPA: hypothetical protein VF026_14740 [Ktedonobacteraceae bacterium]
MNIPVHLWQACYVASKRLLVCAGADACWWIAIHSIVGGFWLALRGR